MSGRQVNVYDINDTILTELTSYAQAYQNACIHDPSQCALNTTLGVSGEKAFNDDVLALANNPPGTTVTLSNGKQYTIPSNASELYLDSSMNQPGIKTTAENVQQLRSQLDKKLFELQNNPAGNDVQLILDTTIYASICWTILATSLVYIVFVEL